MDSSTWTRAFKSGVAVAIALIGLFHCRSVRFLGGGAHVLDERVDFSWILQTRRSLDAGRNIDAPGMQSMDRILDVVGMQPSRDDELADAVDDSGPGLNALPVEGLTSAAEFYGRGGIDQYAGDDAGTKAVSFEEEVSVLGHVDFVHALALVSLIGLHQSDGDRFSRGHVENLGRE